MSNPIKSKWSNGEIKGMDALNQGWVATKGKHGTQMNFAGREVRDTSFRGVNFDGADLSNATFTGCIFDSALFAGSQIGGATFDGACTFKNAEGVTVTQVVEFIAADPQN